jgi:hypothetical protein
MSEQWCGRLKDKAATGTQSSVVGTAVGEKSRFGWVGERGPEAVWLLSKQARSSCNYREMASRGRRASTSECGIPVSATISVEGPKPEPSSSKGRKRDRGRELSAQDEEEEEEEEELLTGPIQGSPIPLLPAFTPHSTMLRDLKSEADIFISPSRQCEPSGRNTRPVHVWKLSKEHPTRGMAITSTGPSLVMCYG